MVDNGRKVCSSVNTLNGGNLFFLELYILRYLATRMPRIKVTQTEHQLAHKVAILMMSPVYVRTRTNTVATEFRGD